MIFTLFVFMEFIIAMCFLWNFLSLICNMFEHILFGEKVQLKVI